MAQEPFCPNCGAILRPGETKCHDCGAPIGGPRPTPRSSKAPTAGLLLVSLFALSLFQGIFVVMNPDLPAEQPLVVNVGTFEVAGRVLDATGHPVQGANVSILRHENLTTTTGADGNYSFPQVPAGIVDVEANASGTPSTTVRVFLVRNQVVDVRLGAAGTPDTIVRHESYPFVTIVTQTCGVLLLGLGGLAFLGAIACYRRKNYGLALAGAIASVVVSVPLSLVIGAIAITLVVSSRAEFAKRAP